MVTKLVEGINWVGYVDWTVRDFHSYATKRGATYNAYLIRDEKIALVDSVKAPYVKNLIDNLARLTDLQKIDYVVCNHAEPDHSGALPILMPRLPNAKIVCDAKCRDILNGYYDTTKWQFQIVKSGDVLSLGKKSLTFLEVPMVHWPDSMVSYLAEEKILFSNDAFGQHLATSQRFADEVDQSVLFEEAKTYYANIVMPYSKQVLKTLEAASKLDIKIIAPSHGVIWRRELGKIIGEYQKWASFANAKKALIVYDSMWESTAKMAHAIYDGAATTGIDARLMRIRTLGNTEFVAEALDATAIICGSATLNQKIMPAMASALTYLQGLKPQNKMGFAFGSYGWGAKGGADEVQTFLTAMGMEILREPIKCAWVPTTEILETCFNAGKEIGNKIVNGK